MNNYDESTASDTSDDEDPIECFFHTNLDAIIDIYDDFRDRFGHNPMFLQHLSSSDLTDFFIDCIYHNKPVHSLTENDSIFYHEFYYELDISYMIVNNFLHKYKYKLPRTTWIQFCCTFT